MIKMLTIIRIKSMILAAGLLCATAGIAQNSCGTGAPPEEWELAFRELVKKQAATMMSGKSNGIHRVIPVIVHVLHNGENIGVFPNIDSSQVKSQFDALNKDFSGIGDGASGVPNAFASLVTNSGIQFCRAAVDYTGAAMIEHGLNRINVNAKSWQNLATPTLNLQQYLETVIIPQTIWDPAKYINIWVSDRPASTTLLSFGTYPPQSGLIGITGQVGTGTYDGMWVWAKAFGTTGDATAPFDKGRTCTHQMGHYFGVRHIWGDGNCLPDYCNDTPPQKGPTTGCMTFPTPHDECGVNASPNGRMFMNFMDESDDICRYMFTPDQILRMHTSLNQSPLRLALGTHGLCSSSYSTPAASAAVASFTIKGVPCLDKPQLLINNSSGWPQPTYLWSSSPAAAFLPNNTSSHPMLVMSNPGTYVITLVATNSISTSSYSMQITTHFTCTPENICVDSLRMIKKTDTLALYPAPVDPNVAACTNSNSTGWLTGTSCYQDKELAQFYPASTFSTINYPQVNSLIILFDSAATDGGTMAVKFRIYGGDAVSGPKGELGLKTLSMSVISSAADTLSTSLIGKPGLPVPGRRIMPYKVDFDKPVQITAPGTGFFAAVELPHLSPSDKLAIFSDTKTNSSPDSSAWFRNYFGTWRTFKLNRGADVHLAIIPQITCGPLTGIKHLDGLQQHQVTLMPNPGSGEFMLVFSLPQEKSRLSIRVLNSVGQQLIMDELHDVRNHVALLDMNRYAPGVYFAEISDGKQKVVKKIVLTR